MRYLFSAMIIMLLCLMAACGGDESGNALPETGGQGETPTGGNDPVTSEGSQKPQQDPDPVELVFYSNSGDSVESFDERFGDALRNRFPHFTIKYIQSSSKTATTLPEILASGTKFDIFFATIGNYERYLLESDLQYDMSELIKKHNVNLNSLDASFVDYMQHSMGGKIYGFPVQNNVMVLYYNKDIFQKFGVSEPVDGMTWEEALELSKRLTRSDDGKQYIGLSVNPNNTVKQNQFSIPSVDPQTILPTINSNEIWRKIYDTLFLKPAQDEQVREEINRINKVPDHGVFVNDQNLAMYGYSSGLISVWVDNLKKLDWDLVSLPTFDELPGVGSQPYPVFMGVTSLSTHPDEAMQAIQYLISAEPQAAMSKNALMPVLVDEKVQQMFGSESEFKDKHLSAVFFNKMAAIADQTPPYAAVISNLYAKDAVPVVQGKVDMNTSFRETEEEAIKQINELKNK